MAKMIKNKAFINEKVNDEVKLLQEEVRKLREEIVAISNGKAEHALYLKIPGLNYICSECKNKCVESSANRGSFFVKDSHIDP